MKGLCEPEASTFNHTLSVNGLLIHHFHLPTTHSYTICTCTYVYTDLATHSVLITYVSMWYVCSYVVRTHIRIVPVTYSSPVIIVVHNGFAVENGQEAEQQSPVPVISHTPSIVALSRQIGQRIQGHILIVIQEHL